MLTYVLYKKYINYFLIYGKLNNKLLKIKVIFQVSDLHLLVRHIICIIHTKLNNLIVCVEI